MAWSSGKNPWISKVTWSRISCLSKLYHAFSCSLCGIRYIHWPGVQFHHLLFLFRVLQAVASVLYINRVCVCAPLGGLSLLEDCFRAVYCYVSCVTFLHQCGLLLRGLSGFCWCYCIMLFLSFSERGAPAALKHWSVNEQSQHGEQQGDQSSVGGIKLKAETI